VYDGIPYQVKQDAGDRGITAVWPVAMYGCETWRLRKNEETRLDSYEMKGLRKILWISWTAKKTNECVLNKPGVKT